MELYKYVEMLVFQKNFYIYQMDNNLQDYRISWK